MSGIFSTYSSFRDYMYRHGYLANFEDSNDIRNFDAGRGGAISLNHYVYRTEVLFKEYSTAIVVGLLVVIGIWTFSRRALNLKYDSREPPIIHPKVPYIGHILGMYRHGAKYFGFVKYVPITYTRVSVSTLTASKPRPTISNLHTANPERTSRDRHFCFTCGNYPALL
jgi:hypothetical protein